MIEVEIKDSPIAGKGVFAKQDVNPGELIGVYEGKLVWKSEDMENPYVLWLEDDAGRFFGIDAQNNMRYLNHEGETPNAVLSANSPFIYCARPIETGEEITVSYSEDTDFDEDEE